jgi:hypothetical protein
VHFRASAITESEEEAKHVTEQVGAFLNLFHTSEGAVGTSGPDPDVKAVFDSLKVEQQSDRAVLTATIPVGFIRKALAEGPATALSPPAPPPSPEPKSSSRKTKHQKGVKPR